MSVDPLPSWMAEIPSAPVHQQPPGQLVRPFTTQQLIEIGKELIEQFIRRVVLAVAGFFIPGGGPAFEQLQAWANNLSSEITAKINDVAGINLASWDAFLASLEDGKGIDLPAIPKVLAALEGIPWESGDPGAILRAILAAGVQLVRGVIPAWMLPPTHIGRITGELPSLVNDGGFDLLPSGSSGGPGEWFRDAVRGRTKPGAVGIEADGAFHDFVCQPVAVAKGQTYRIGAFPSCESATSSAGSVKLLLVEWADGEEPINTVEVASWTPSGTVGFGTEIHGTYTVPDGVQMAGVALAVTGGFTAGSVWLDDVTGPSTGQLQMGWTEGLIQRWEQIAKLFGIVDTDLDGDVDLVDIWNTLWSVWLKPLNWIPTVAQDIIDRIINAFENLGSLLDFNLPGSGILDAIFGIFDTGLTANNRISDFEARLIAMESSANTILVNFDGGSASSLGGSFSQAYSGGGAGNLGLDGKGNAVWKPSGAGNRTCIARYTTSALTVNNGLIQAQLASTPQSYIFDDAYTYLCWRMNTAGDTYMRLRIGWDSVRLQKVVSGSVTNVGSAWNGSPKGGNVFDVNFGDPGDTNHGHHVVKRNGVTIIDATDGSPTYGGSYLHVGIGMETGNRLIITQNIPAGLGVFMAAEVL